mmetsp:Transcript_7883/g.18430  ORF Transcript_7883/g.18430 Transcript_7883/m.18430 type:complete len:222 (-) Transcript_7883:43-708(-)
MRCPRCALIVTSQVSEMHCNVDGEGHVLSFTATFSSTHISQSSSTSFSASALFSSGPKMRTSCNARSMWMRQPLCSCKCSNKDLEASSSVLVRMSSHQTGYGTGLCNPPSDSNCLLTTSMTASVPTTRKILRRRSKRILASGLFTCNSRKRRRPRRHRETSMLGLILMFTAILPTSSVASLVSSVSRSVSGAALSHPCSLLERSTPLMTCDSIRGRMFAPK